MSECHKRVRSYVFFIACVIAIVCDCHVVFASGANQGGEIEVSEGENLLLRPKVGKLIYEYDIYAFYQDDKAYFSIVDIIDVLELSINYDEETGKGVGWFLREDWKIIIDLENNQVVSKDKAYAVGDKDKIIDNGVVFIAQDVLSQWFDMQFKVDVPQQYLEIESPYPLPGVARYYRMKKQRGGNQAANIAVLPRKKIEYDWFDINTADIRLGARHRRYQDARPSSLYSGTLAVEGQALKHEAYALANGDSRNRLTNVTARLSKRDEDPVLLGPLKARSYTIGDTNLTDVPLTGDARQELGFHVSNSKLDNVQFQSTDISGDAIPGWDVELYRNGVLLSSFVIGDDGFYEFADVQLFGGDNEFELFFYGPQGEIRQREINVPVTAALLAAQNGVYDVSVSLTETKTFQKNQANDIDRETPHIAARYNKSIGDVLTYVGVRNRDIEGDNKTFIGAGFTSLVKNTIIDGSVGIDDKASTAAQLTLRKNVNDWNLSFNGKVQDKDYIVNEVTVPTTLSLSSNVQKSFMPSRGSRFNVSATAEYATRADDRSQVSGRFGTSYQKGRLNFSNNVYYERLDQLSGETQDRLDNSFAVRANMGKYFVRAGVDYDIKPITQVDRYFSQVNYYPTPRLSGDVRLDHEPDRDFTEMRLGVNYTHDYFRASPFIEVDNQNEVLAGVNVNFNVIDTPDETKPMITSDRSVGRGLVSSFVFYDKNGNNVFDESDEPLPDVTVKSVNVKRRANTNEKGYSLINDLPTSRATDIKLDEQSLPDPYMIAATEGVSIFASAGEIVELNFPVHLSGEIDGTVSVRDQKGGLKPIKRADILLYPVGSKKAEAKKVRAAFDGFYVASQIPPGRYVMAVSNETAKRAKASLPPPRIVNIGYDGDTIYGSNFELNKGRVNVPVDVVYRENVTSDILYGLKTTPQQTTKLLGLFGELNSRNNGDVLYAGLEEMKSGTKGEKIYKLPSNDLEASHKKCRELAENAVPCVLQIYVPSQMEAVQTASR